MLLAFQLSSLQTVFAGKAERRWYYLALPPSSLPGK